MSTDQRLLPVCTDYLFETNNNKFKISILPPKEARTGRGFDYFKTRQYNFQ